MRLFNSHSESFHGFLPHQPAHHKCHPFEQKQKAHCHSLLNLPSGSNINSNNNPSTMVRTKASEKARKKLAAANKKCATDPMFKAGAVTLIMRDFYRNKNEEKHIENELLYDTIGTQQEQIVALNHRIQNQRELLDIKVEIQRTLTENANFYEDIIREIYLANPAIVWQYRNRLSFDDIPQVDPEETEPESDTALLEDEDWQEESLEERMEREMQEEVDQANGFF